MRAFCRLPRPRNDGNARQGRTLDGNLRARALPASRAARPPRAIRSDTPFGKRPDQRPAPAFPGQSFALSRLSRRRGWRQLYGEPLEHRLAPIVDAGRARLRAVGERLQQIGQLGIPVLFHEARHLVGPAAAARLANDRQRRLSHVGQSERTVARHLPHLQVLAPQLPNRSAAAGGVTGDRVPRLKKDLGNAAILARRWRHAFSDSWPRGDAGSAALARCFDANDFCLIFVSARSVAFLAN
jgi:hypothetical protein